MERYPLNSGGWIRDAGIVGFLRIKAWTCEEEVIRRLLEEGLSEEDLRCFALQYWAYATLHFLKSDPLNALGKPLKKLVDEGIIEEDRYRDFIDNLRGGLTEVKIKCECEDIVEEWGEFANNLKEIFENWINWVEEEVMDVVLREVRDKFPEIYGHLGSAPTLNELLKVIDSPPKGVITNIENLKSFRKQIGNISKVMQNINKSASDLAESIKFFSYQSVRLGSYYFNKGQINNPKGKDPKRLLKFHDIYVKPAIGILRGDEDYTGHDYTCTFCGRPFSVPKEWKKNVPFSEGDFAPLGVSVKNFPNFFYEGNAPQKCPICQLMLLCSFAGFNRKPWQLHDVEGTDHIFVHMPDLESTYRTNETFSKTLANISGNSLKGGTNGNVYLEAVQSAIESVKYKASWALQNILFVEIKPTPSKQRGKPKLTYFNVDRGLATVFSGLTENQREALTIALNTRYRLHNININLGTETIKRLLNKTTLMGLIFPYFKDYLEGKARLGALWWMIVLEHLTNQARRQIKGGQSMDVQEIYRRLWVLRRKGAEVLPQIDLDKRRRIGQRFIGLIRGGRKEEFYNELLRLFVVYEEEIPSAIFSLIAEEDHLTFQEKALAFLTGFVSPNEVKGDENKQEVTQSEA